MDHMTNQQCHSTEGRWLVNHVNNQSHQAQLTKRYREGCKQKTLIYSTTKTKDTEVLGRQTAKPSKIKA